MISKEIVHIRYLVFTGFFLLAFYYIEAQVDLCNLDKSKMIPLREADFRKYQYVVKLRGSAIKDSLPYEIHYDSGSWTTSIPGGALDLQEVDIVKVDTRDPWGNSADLVSGQLILESVDGTPYILNDYLFYATKDAVTGQYLEDDRTEAYGQGTNSILGAFPSIDPNTRIASVPFAIAQKYAANHLSLAIISDCLDDISKWNSFRSYLQIGPINGINDEISWRTDIPNWRIQSEFHPEAIPGFMISISLPDQSQTIQTAGNLLATLDTGAPDLTLKLGSENFHLQEPFSSHFIKDGPWINWNDDYRQNATSLIDASVLVEFTDSDGETNSYEFIVEADPYLSPATMYVGTWDSGVPWPEILPDKPKNRINLGNTVYFYCPAVVWDIDNKKMGLGFRSKQTTGSSYNANEEFLIYPNPVQEYLMISSPSDVKINSVLLYDLRGRIIETIPGEGNQIVIRNKYQGMAFLHIDTNRGLLNKKVWFVK